ncbi:MAG: hypothetical protein R2991_11875 [Thermoanaerobaculia bacterium]
MEGNEANVVGTAVARRRAAAALTLLVVGLGIVQLVQGLETAGRLVGYYVEERPEGLVITQIVPAARPRRPGSEPGTSW